MSRGRPRSRRHLESWNPGILILQILLLEIAFYIIAGAALYALALSLTFPFSLDLIFSWTPLQSSNPLRYSVLCAYCCTSCIVIPATILIVRRAKMVLDFVLTLHGFHFLTVCIQSGRIPSATFWWIWYFSSVVIVWLGSWYGCAWFELMPISFSNQSTQQQGYEMV